MNVNNIEKEFRDKFGTRQYGQKDSEEEKLSEDDFEEVRSATVGLPKELRLSKEATERFDRAVKDCSAFDNMSQQLAQKLE